MCQSEIRELIGVYLLFKMDEIRNQDVGLYKDDGLIIIEGYYNTSVMFWK